MKINRSCVFVVIVGVFLSGTFGSMASADSTQEFVSQGMTYQDVTKIMGAPLEKHERGVKREDTWVYKDIEVNFREGIVTTSEYRNGGAHGGDPFGTENINLADLGVSDQPNEAVVVEEILEEIMQGAGDEGK